MAKKERKLKLYVCGTDWYHELGEEMAKPDVVVYPSAKSLKKHRTCWKEDGIVELEVKLSKWVKNPMPMDKLIKKYRKSIDKK